MLASTAPQSETASAQGVFVSQSYGVEAGAFRKEGLTLAHLAPGYVLANGLELGLWVERTFSDDVAITGYGPRARFYGLREDKAPVTLFLEGWFNLQSYSGFDLPEGSDISGQAYAAGLGLARTIGSSDGVALVPTITAQRRWDRQKAEFGGISVSDTVASTRLTLAASFLIGPPTRRFSLTPKLMLMEDVEFFGLTLGLAMGG